MYRRGICGSLHCGPRFSFAGQGYTQRFGIYGSCTAYHHGYRIPTGVHDKATSRCTPRSKIVHNQIGSGWRLTLAAEYVRGRLRKHRSPTREKRIGKLEEHLQPIAFCDAFRVRLEFGVTPQCLYHVPAWHLRILRSGPT